MGLEDLFLRLLIHVTGKSVLAVGTKARSLIKWTSLNKWLIVCPHNMVVDFPKASDHISKAEAVFYDLAFEFTHCHFHTILLVTQVTVFSVGGEFTGT